MDLTAQAAFPLSGQFTYIYTYHINIYYAPLFCFLFFFACDCHSVRFIFGQCRLILVTLTCKSASIV